MKEHEEARENGQMVCVCCGGFSSSRVCWHCSNNIANAAHNKLVHEVLNKYNELIHAVATKYPNESRHETALRYIKEREEQTDKAPPEAQANAAKETKP